MLDPMRRLVIVVATLLIAGCATVESPHPPLRTSAEAQACAEWLAQLDDVVDRAGTRDAGAHRIAGHPYLRADRFLASFRHEAKQPGPAFNTWVERQRRLDLAGREAELCGLAPALLQPLATSVTAALGKLDQCGQVLAREDLATPAGRDRLKDLTVVPDDYAQWVRSSGLYALARWPFSLGVEGWHREAEAMFRKAATDASVQRIRRVDPAGAAVSPTEVRDVFAQVRRDALGVPLLSPQDESLLFRAYAPRYEIEATGSFDRFGALKWPDAAPPQVDSSRPVVYRRLAHTRFQGRVLVQLVYTMWFPERPRSHPLDLLGGALDGLVMRVTLGEDGAPLVWDTIHPCGCYHMFFPTTALKAVPAPDPDEEWAFIPARLPAMGPADRVTVRTATATHYLVSVSSAPAGAIASETYTLADEDELRRLPLPGGGFRSIYGPDALVRGSERAERLFFWPMGIASPGTMRQWGRHPTAFLGRRHFDDPDIVEKRFVSAASER